MANDADLIIIGAGPGGYVAAIRAAQLGARVILVEREKIGGICLNKGCIPTKALLRSAEVLAGAKRAPEFGVQVEGVVVDFPAMQERKKQVVSQVVKGVAKLLEARGVTILEGHGRLLKSTVVKVSGACQMEVTAPRIILATGSQPARPPIPGSDLPGVMTSDELLEIESVPESLAIVGGGVIGVEFAFLFHTLGTRVAVIEMLPRLLPLVDGELARRAYQAMRRRGMEINLRAQVERIQISGKGLGVSFHGPASKGKVWAEVVLLAVGRIPNTKGLGLDEVGVELKGRAIAVDEYLETNVRGIYAIGDVNGGPMLAHRASWEGERAAENALGERSPVDYRSVPYCVYSLPEMAGVGLTEEELQEKGIPYVKSRFPFSANARSWVLGEPEGMVKMLCHRDTKELLGLHIFGPQATELIAEGALALKLRAKAQDIAAVVHAHPTLSEAIREAALAQLGGAIHSL